MRPPGRLIIIVAGLAVVSAASMSTGVSAPARSVGASSAATRACLSTPAPGVLPSPPVIDTAVTANFDLYVKQGVTLGPKGQSTTLYCYVASKSGDTSYVEAPTIRVKQGGTFTMTLHNLIPYSGPSPIPTPPQKILISPDDGCAWLPFDSARLPTPNPSASPGGYFGHQRVPTNPDPPWMLGNDTNFHTHGWHVSPYVDNVYKSLAWSPTRNVCVFKFAVRRSQPPGTYWYHAHLHGISDIQVGGGLAGALIVVPEKPDPSAIREDGDVVLLVKNAARTQTGALPGGGFQAMAAMPGMIGHGTGDVVQSLHYSALAAKFAAAPAPAAAGSPVPFDPFSPPPWTSGWPLPVPLPPYCPPISTDATAGVQALAVNGALIPATYGAKTYPSAGPAVTQPVGSIYRYRVINAASDSYVNLRTVTQNGSTVWLNIVGRDGVPVNWDKTTASFDHSKPSIVREPNVFVPPSGRVDILVVGTSAPLRIISVPGYPTPTSASGTPYCTGYLGDAMPQRIILAIKPPVGPRALLAARTLTTKTGVTAAGQYVLAAQRRNVIRRAITFTMYRDAGFPVFNWIVTPTGMQSAPFTSPATPLPYVERPFWLAQGSVPPNNLFPYVPWIRVHQGDFEEWTLYNASPEIHAFHIHQLTFVATQSPFEATDPTRQVFLDSIALPAATASEPNAVANAGSSPQPTPTPNFPLLTPSVTKIQIDFSNVDTGVFVFHCHMLFHEDHGMMGVIEVLPPRNGPVQKTF